MSEKNLKKLDKLRAKLNEIYPCELSNYTIKEDFSQFQTFGEGLNHATYFKLKIASILPSHIKTCLYLDTDMLCVGDIRELFELNLEDKILACVLDKKSLNTQKILHKKDPSKDYILRLDKTYFNAGFLFINLNKFRLENIEEKIFLLLKDYVVDIHDQGAFNAVLCDKKDLKILSFKYNFLQHINFKTQTFYTQKECDEALKDIKIIHYTDKKPWNSFLANTLNLQNTHIKLWWDMALKTPCFKKEFKKLQLQALENELLNLIDPRMSNARFRIKTSLAYELGACLIRNQKSFKLPFLLIKIALKHKQLEKIYQQRIFYNPNLAMPPLELCKDYQNALKLENHLSYQLGNAFLKACKTWYKGGFFIFLKQANEIKKEFKKTRRLFIV
ncbi:glycosyltransferase family 8 protein [Campylobacter sp. MIT 99-7217]|uniref:glycosyltransferase family 8 protein n=1 Tax=Campylobacter sp. MIT 99-7217 TaxID=535091 RepID=UPI0021B00C70|nr:glycosyltransferase family 8 protein [Campylobacter sp. MIT 99-7217]